MSKPKRLLVVLLLVALSGNVAWAQDVETPEPTPEPTPAPTLDLPPLPPVYTMSVTVPAEDELTLVGDLYLIDSARPTVLLLHQLYTNRHSWEPVVIPALLAAGYNVLAVDVRGHGETWGRVNWDMAIRDVQVWLGWMRAHSLGTVVLMGSSMGSTLALVGCGNDPFCLGAIAISPGWNYYEVSVEQTFAALLGGRPVLIVYADHDYWPAVGVPRMVEAATGEVQVVTYPGNVHGMDLFSSEDALIPEVLGWLNTHAG
jgi:pimeloyl-ACP methyl ester carboxylesterase